MKESLMNSFLISGLVLGMTFCAGCYSLRDNEGSCHGQAADYGSREWMCAQVGTDLVEVLDVIIDMDGGTHSVQDVVDVLDGRIANLSEVSGIEQKPLYGYAPLEVEDRHDLLYKIKLATSSEREGIEVFLYCLTRPPDPFAGNLHEGSFDLSQLVCRRHVVWVQPRSVWQLSFMYGLDGVTHDSFDLPSTPTEPENSNEDH